MEEFSGSWFGVGIAVGFGICCLVFAFMSYLCKSKTSRKDWQTPLSATPHAGYQAPTAKSVQSLSTSTRNGATDRKGSAGPLQAAMQVFPQTSVSARDVVLNMAPLAAPAHVALNLNPVPANTTDASANQHKRGVSTASVYDVDNLDDDWTSLLESVDGMLVASGHPTMTASERPVAVRRLVSATSTRGMDGAVKAAVDEIIKFRAWNSAPR